MKPAARLYFVVELLLEPLGLVDEDELPPGLVLLEAPPLGLDDMEPDPLEEDDPLMPLVLPEPLGEELELDEPGLLGADEDEEDEPPGTTIVSFSFVVELLDPEDGAVLLPPGMTVVVSFRSQALSARAAAKTIKYPLRFMSTPFSFCGYKVHPRFSKCCAAKRF